MSLFGGMLQSYEDPHPVPALSISEAFVTAPSQLPFLLDLSVQLLLGLGTLAVYVHFPLLIGWNLFPGKNKYSIYL